MAEEERFYRTPALRFDMIQPSRPLRSRSLSLLPLHRLVVCLGLLACLPSCATSPGSSAPDTPQTAEERLQALSFLSGDWIGPSPKGLWEAHYTWPDGGMMLSTNKEYVEGRGVTIYEFEKFVVEDDKVVLWPYPMGRRAVPFELTTLDMVDRRAVFENPAHDFPQRIEYWRKDANTLEISVTAPSPDDPERQRGFRLHLFAMAPGERPHPRYMRDVGGGETK